jgi:hypothetical protein
MPEEIFGRITLLNNIERNRIYEDLKYIAPLNSTKV